MDGLNDESSSDTGPDDMSEQLPPSITVEVAADDPNLVVIRVAGVIDISTVEVVRESVESTLADGPIRIVFDMSEVEFMDSSGIAALLESADRTTVQIRRPSPTVRRVIELTGLSDVLPFAE